MKLKKMQPIWKVIPRPSRNWLLGLAILLLALLPRLLDLGVFISWDEPQWTSRTAQFLFALQTGKLENTFQVGHPGVTTMWLGATGMTIKCHWSPETCGALPPVGSASDEEQISQEARARVLQVLPAARVPVATAIALGIVVMVFLIRELWGRTVAVASGVLIALDPFYIAHSRLLHLDALTTTFMTLSILAMALYLTRPRGWVSLAVSGGLAGMAFLTKSSSLFLIPFVGFLLALTTWRRNKSWAQWIRDLTLCSAVWGGAALAIFVALWPAMWVDPLGSIQGVLAKGINYAESPHANSNFFLGQARDDPGPGFYPVALLYRMTPLTTLGLVAAILLLLRWGRLRPEIQQMAGPSGGASLANKRPRASLAIVLLYALLFGVFMTLGAKKFDRYLLPIFPSLEIAAAVGLVGLAQLVSYRLQVLRRRTWGPTVGVLLLIVLQATLVLPHHPYYLTYYNPLLGGGRQAQKVLLMGWGEGLDLAADYLNGKPDIDDMEVVVRGKYSFAPFYLGRTLTWSSFHPHQTEYVIFYANEIQRHLGEDLLQQYPLNPQAQPEHVVSLHGIKYAWIYPNITHIQPLAYIQQHASPTEDAILVNGDSLFVRDYQGEIPLHKLYTHWGLQEMIELLDKLPSERRQIWYARYPDADPQVVLDLLENRGVLLDKQSFPDLEVYLFRLIKPATAWHPLNLNFGDQLRLHRFVTTEPALAWGQDGGVVLEWEAQQPLEHNFTAFLHLRDPQGHLIAQGDKLITDESLRPTSQWEPGMPRSDFYRLSIPPGTPPGRYELDVGVYLLATGERVPLLGQTGSSQDTVARLEVEIGSPRHLPTVADLGISYPLDRSLTPQLKLLGYDVGPETVRAGQGITLHLFWQALGTIPEDHRLRLELRGPDGATWSQSEFSLAGTDYPTTRWQPGELIHGRYDLAADEATPTGEMTLEVNLLDEGEQPLLPQPLTVTKVWVQSAKPSFVVPTAIGHRSEVNLGNEVTFLGFDLEASQVRPGDSLHLTLYWQARRQMRKSYTVFVHLYDGEERIWGQRDRLPGQGVHPTTEWQVGEVVVDHFSVPVDPGTLAGTYQLAVGLYDGETGERLPAFGPDGVRIPADSILLGHVQVGDATR